MTPDKALSLANDIACTIATLQAIEDELRTAYPDSDYERDDYEPERSDESPKTVTLDEVRKVLAEKSGAGFREEVAALIQKYGAVKLSEVNPAKYAALLSDAEGLGK